MCTEGCPLLIGLYDVNLKISINSLERPYYFLSADQLHTTDIMILALIHHTSFIIAEIGGHPQKHKLLCNAH